MDQPDNAEILKMNRWFAVQASNHAWDIASKENPVEEDYEEMLMAAYAAGYHWSKTGEDINTARIDMLLAHVHSHMRNAAVAEKHAEKSLFYCRNNEVKPWDLAFSYAELAYACAVSGDMEACSQNLKTAAEEAESIEDQDENNIFMDELDSIKQEIAKVQN